MRHSMLLWTMSEANTNILTGGHGALVACEASHMCMVARGVEKHASSTITTAARGAYLQHSALRAKTLQHLMQHQSESESILVR